MAAQTSSGRLAIGSPSNVVLGFGRTGEALVPPELASLVHFGGEATLAAYGLCSWDRGAEALDTPLPRVAAPDLTPTPNDLYTLRLSLHPGQPGQLSSEVTRAVFERLVTAIPPSAPVTPSLLCHVDLGDVERIAAAVSQLKTNRLQGIAISLDVRWPEPGHEDTRTGAGIRLLRGLRAEEIIDVAYVRHPRSFWARHEGEDRQDLAVARVFAALQMAPWVERHNRHLAHVSQSLGTPVMTPAGMRGTFAAMALGTAPVAAGAPHFASPWLRRLGRQEVGYGDPADCFQQVTALAARLYEDERMRTVAVEVGPLTIPPVEYVVVLPIDPRDPRFADLVLRLRAWWSGALPFAGTPIIVGGSGRIGPQRSTDSRYFCLVACLYGLADDLLQPPSAGAQPEGGTDTDSDAGSGHDQTTC